MRIEILRCKLQEREEQREKEVYCPDRTRVMVSTILLISEPSDPICIKIYTKGAISTLKSSSVGEH